MQLQPATITVQLEPELLTDGWRWATNGAAALLLAHATLRAPWRAWLLARADRQHVWLGGIVLLTLVWSMRAGVTPGLSFHFLLATALTLMHGWRLALVAIALVLGALAVLRGGAAAWGANFLCVGVVPVALVAAVHVLVQRWLPHNYFVYFFGTVFAGSLLAFVAAGLASYALLVLSGTTPAAHASRDWFVWLPVLGFGEAFVNGIVMAMAVVYRPEWVSSFDDRLYLRRR